MLICQYSYIILNSKKLQTLFRAVTLWQVLSEFLGCTRSSRFLRFHHSDYTSCNSVSFSITATETQLLIIWTSSVKQCIHEVMWRPRLTTSAMQRSLFCENWAPTPSLGNRLFSAIPCHLFALSCNWRQGKITGISRVTGRVCKTKLRS